MKKIFYYVILGVTFIAFIYIFIRTGSFMFSLVAVGIGLVLLLFENLFDLLSLFGPKSEDINNDNSYKKNKENLEKATKDNPTLR